MHRLLEATWYETVDDDGVKKIYHTIPRIKRLPESLLTDEIYPSSNGLEELLTITPNKRAALLLDRIMVALQKAVDDDKDLKLKTYYPELGTSLQRRGQEKGKVYWRCYFNAVTCF
ncbi:hypothetical protein PGB90_009634 [Kerria lacca]